MVTPDDWTIARLRDVARLSAGINKPLSAMGRGALYLTVQELYEGSHVDPACLGRIDVSADEISRFHLEPGDVIFGKSSVKRDGIGYPNRFIGAPEAVVNSGFTYLARPNHSVIDATFLFHTLRDHSTRRWVINNSQASALTNLNAKIAADIPIRMPCALSEQRLIAEALSDADAATEALDALIAKKRDLKLAAMQQLLTARTRLPGFAGEWEEGLIGSLFTFQRTTALSRAQLSDAGEIGYIHYGDIHSRWDTHLDLSRHSLPGVDFILAGTAAAVVDGDLVLADASEDLDGVGKAVEVMGIGSRHVIAGLHTVLLRPRPGAFAPGFVGYVPLTAGFKMQARTLAAGLKVYGLSKTSLRQIAIRVPTAQEQAAIAQVLMDMDAEVEALVAERDKMRLVKQGMMQELLSGRVRLV